MGIQVRPDGPIPAHIMIVGEAPGAEEEARGVPFCGASGMELNKMLHEVGITRSECFVTNVCRERPYNNDIGTLIALKKKDITSEHREYMGRFVRPPVVEGISLLHKEIKMVQPNVIISLGGTPLWALTGLSGITKWRGSMLYYTDGVDKVKVIPTIHPAAILRQWSDRAIAVNDLKRAARFRNGEPYPDPKWNFTIRPSFQTAWGCLRALSLQLEQGYLRVSFDLETRAGHIACAGISWNLQDAISIPFMCVESNEGYWSEEEETALVYALYKILTHKNVGVIGQNLLYDSQYTYRHWHFIPRVQQDTMISHHVCFAGLPKRLDFQASMYCDQYRYWKDDSKHWEKGMGENQLWAYNCEDCVRTDECAHVESDTIKHLGLEVPEAFQQSMFLPVLQAMILGVRIDKDARNRMTMELMEEMGKREEYFKAILGHPLNPRSPKQMMSLFYSDLNQPVIMKRAKKGIPSRPTLDDEALEKLGAREPLLRPLLKSIAEYRSLGVFLGTFVQAPLDDDGRMRCSYNICGTETYRLSSSENAFESGTNLQNLPKGTEAKEPEDLVLPNIRKLFIPDPGFTFFDMDLDRADLQVVVWEADDAELKQMLREGVDIHEENSKVLGIVRQEAKKWVHGTNYGGSPRTMAANCGFTVHQAERMQARWFAAHPGIKSWHQRTEAQLRSRRYVENKFGFRRFYFDRVEGLLSEALAWIPQSTVAITINKIWRGIYTELPCVQVLLQVHDSLAGQFRTSDGADVLPRMQSAARAVVIPYQDPLIIPVGIKTSPISWGDCS